MQIHFTHTLFNFNLFQNVNYPLNRKSPIYLDTFIPQGKYHHFINVSSCLPVRFKIMYLIKDIAYSLLFIFQARHLPNILLGKINEC